MPEDTRHIENRKCIFVALPLELWAESPQLMPGAFTVFIKRVIRLSLPDALAAWWYGVEVPIYKRLTFSEAEALHAALTQGLAEAREIEK